MFPGNSRRTSHNEFLTNTVFHTVKKTPTMSASFLLKVLIHEFTILYDRSYLYLRSLIFNYQQPGLQQDRTKYIIQNCNKNGRYNRIDKRCRCTPFCKYFCHLLRLSQNILLVKITNQRICHHIKSQSCNRGNHTPPENILDRKSVV